MSQRERGGATESDGNCTSTWVDLGEYLEYGLSPKCIWMEKKWRAAAELNYSKKKVDAYLDICGVGQREARRRSESYPLGLKTSDVRSKSRVHGRDRERKLRC